ncbi:MAG TPA: hypothetical protein VKX46_12025 [Ktedonobacteraceae bacterium]|nr:hypothetical protein [Ktedonobacteraceae bacterium]
MARTRRKRFDRARAFVDPATDMAVVCANCHRMIHRDPDRPLSIEELRQIIAAHRSLLSTM